MFERMILTLFSILGLLNGVFFSIIYRKSKFYIYIVLSLLISLSAAGFFLWYARGYDSLGS